MFLLILCHFLLRARLKKDNDDFRKHPDYDDFVREELQVEEEIRPTKFLNSPVGLPKGIEENDREKNLGEIVVGT